MATTDFSFEVRARNSGPGYGRTGVITTPHGQIRTPAFIPVGTKAAMKAVLPDQMTELGAQALLANAYHLYLQPGPEVVAAAGGLAKFMSWDGPTFTDSGGFQVMSLGSGGQKVINMDAGAPAARKPGKPLTRIDDDGVWFTSHLDGSKHRFTPEISIRIQQQIGADIIFAFDELTTLDAPKAYQEKALERTRRWALRCLAEHHRQPTSQALFGVIQGANYEDLRRQACRDLGAMGFDGFGIGGAIEKERLAEIVSWCSSELPEDKPRHLLGISEPDDLMNAIEAGIDTFDCVSPTRVARNTAYYRPDGRYNLRRSIYRTDFEPLAKDCACYACANFTRAYIHHLFRAKEMLAATLTSIHNEHFIVSLVDGAREAIEAGEFYAYKAEVLGRYYGLTSDTVTIIP